MSQFVKMIDLYNNGIEFEVIVINHNPANGDLFFIRTQDLDSIDYERMARILRRREADGRMPLWDLLDSITLKNGMNALKYFHQLVQVRTSSGQIIKPDTRRRGSRPKMSQMVSAPTVANTELNAVQAPDAVATNVQAPPAPVRQGKKTPKPDQE